jgi:protein-disulfide isomerase
MTKDKGTPKKDNFTRNLVVAVIVGVALIMLVPTFLSKQSDDSAAIPALASVQDGYGIAFNADLTSVPKIEVYEDFQCPYCAGFEGLAGAYLDELIAKKEAKVVYNPMTFIGLESLSAANAAGCAADEGKFKEFHKLLFANLPNKENTGTWTNEYLKAAGQGVGISSQQFSSCVDDMKYANWTKNVSAAASKANVNSTPTIFINGRKIDNKVELASLDAFKAAVAKG